MMDRLKSLVKIVDLGGVSRAAKSLHLTQPALTQHIRFLEKRFGKTLLRRKGNNMELSPEGEHLYGLAKNLLVQYEKLEKAFSFENITQGKLKFSSVDSTMESIVPKALKKLLAKRRNIKVHPSIYATSVAVQHLLAEKIDFAICTIDHLPPELSAETLFKESLVFIGSKEHAAIQRKAELKKEKFILFPRSSLTRFQIDNVFRRLGFTPKIVFENIKVSAIVSLVEAGLGLSIVPYHSVQADLQNGRVYPIPVATKAGRTVGIAYKKGKPLSPLALEFIHCLREESQKFISN